MIAPTVYEREERKGRKHKTEEIIVTPLRGFSFSLFPIFKLKNSTSCYTHVYKPPEKSKISLYLLPTTHREQKKTRGREPDKKVTYRFNCLKKRCRPFPYSVFCTAAEVLG